MSWWLLLLVGLGVPNLYITINGTKVEVGSWFRLIVFICCCIWG